MPVALLAAVAKFASADETRPNLNGVFVDKDEIVACDGHRLVRVDTRVGPFQGSSIDEAHASYLIPLEVVRAVCAGAKEIRAKRVRITTVDPTVDRLLRIEVRSAIGGRLFVVEGPAGTLKYPPVDAIMGETREGEPPSITFNPRLIEDIAPVMDACDVRGLEIAGWGNEFSPMQFAAAGIRFVVMPMRSR